MLLTTLNRSRRGRHGRKGFTLIELMIALVIMGLIMSVVYKVFSSQDRFFRNQEQISSMQENLRATVEYINQELSWLGYRVPGIAVIKAAPTDIIFKANIPNTGTTIQYVRYQFNPSTNTISRAAGAASSDVESADLTIMASDIEAMGFSYFNVQNNMVVTTTADPLCADELTAAVCAPGTPDDDSSLLMVQRVKARVTARTTKPDWLYTDPNGGPNPNFRKRKAVLDLRSRNIEDVTLQGGQIVIGSCGYMTHTIANYGSYVACADKTYYLSNYRPNPANNTWDDNPSITIQAYDMDGNLNTNPNQVTYVYAVADDGTPYNIYDPADPYAVDNTISNGETRYLSAQDLSTVSTGTHVEVRFAYSDGVCTQVSYDGDHDIIVASNPASHFLTTATMPDGLTLEHVDNSGATITLNTPDKVAMCSTVGNERVLLGAQLDDDCGNPIPGETIAWSDGGFGGSFAGVSDNGDGTYSATYIPPDSKGSVAPEYTATLTAQWGSFSPNVSVDFIAAQPHDIVIDSIVDVTQAGIFQFASNVLPRATQLGGNSGNDFTIERVDGQEVGITFHLEDACGNVVFDSLSINHSATKGNVSSMVNNGDGTYSFVWESNIGCGLESLGEAIVISSPAIANPATQSETVSFDLLTTRSSDPLAGPFVHMDKIPITGVLQAGNTGDSVTVKASIMQYDVAKQYCTNILPGSMSPFSIDYSLTGDTGGNGSFIAVTPFDDISESVSTDSLGEAFVDVYSGTADWDDAITVTAEANVEGAFYSGSIVLSYKETNHPQPDSGFYEDSLFTTEIGDGHPTTTFDPGDDLYLLVYDYDENEDPTVQDSFSAPYDVEVVVESNLTGDIETVGLTEDLDKNSPDFMRILNTSFFPAIATTLHKDDGVLQVRDGDTITMSYEDKDNPADADSWTIYTPGADSFRIYRVDGVDEYDVYSAGVQVEDVAYGEQMRPKLSLPFLAGDGRIALDTVSITVDSAADTDFLVLREDGDTGIMVPDDTIYSGTFFSVLQSDIADAEDILATPTTPRYVTLQYDAAGSYAMTLSFFMRDYDPPEVIITSPADGATVSGQVTVIVEANDVGNATTWGGISRIEFYVNGRLYQTVVGADLSGSNSFTWTTALAGTPYWLDGSHTLTARAFDTSNNEATSDPVGVSVNNNLSPIWFNDPPYNSIWSADMDVEIEVDNLAAEMGTYEVLLNVNGNHVATWTDTGSETFYYTVDTTLEPEGQAELIAVIRDLETNEYQTTALEFFVDRTPPVINIGTPFDLPWINKTMLPLNVEATITDFRFAPADPNDVDDSTVTAEFSGACSSGTLGMTEVPPGGDTYTVSWVSASCDDQEAILTVTIEADDMADPPNQASWAFSTRLDTLKPTVDTLDVIPMVNQPFTMGSLTFDGFIRGDVTLQADVTDGNLGSSIGAFTAWFYQDPWMMIGPPDGTQYLPLEDYQSAAAGAFTDTWPTGSYSNGIYVLAAGVVDSAGNSSDSTPSMVLYLDNNDPWINAPWLNSMITTYEPISGMWVPVINGLANVTMNADDWGGFLRKIEHRFVTAGDTPGTANTPSPFVVNSVEYNFAADEKVRHYEKSYTINTCGVPEGAYDVYGFATDWAGNMAPVGFTTFVVEDWTYLLPPNAVDPVVHFEVHPPAANNEWDLESDGWLQNCGGPVDGLNVQVNFYRWTWNGALYNWEPPFTDFGTTSNGDMPTLTAPSGLWTYTSNSMGAVEYIDPATTEIYAVFHPMTINSPQQYDMYGTYAPWYVEFHPFNQHRMLTDVTYDLAPSVLPAHELTLEGTMRFNSGYPAINEPVILELGYTDPMSGWMWTTFSTVTDLSGEFSFTPAADISITDNVNINLRHPSLYWGDTWMGWLNWDPWLDRWNESL